MNCIMLRQKMIERGLQCKDITEALEISRSATVRKMSNKTEFTQSEIKGLIRLLDLSPDEVMSIFFANKVS